MLVAFYLGISLVVINGIVYITTYFTMGIDESVQATDIQESS